VWYRPGYAIPPKSVTILVNASNAGGDETTGSRQLLPRRCAMG
jgi:hypothetical protein